ncbi:hypothetical protein V502_10666 [Pseudogymnoascus sp. VKM F-4520 (FW-2644)]|nr:hypothetical protein V502_10666 [Pseudogymnoascus sp. VKM F-4520 (FW-2644)]
MQGIYTHFCARAKLHLDWASDPDGLDKSPHTRARLVEFMERFALVPDYDLLERKDFHELTGKKINTRPDKPVEAAYDLVRGTDFFLGRVASPPVSKRQRLDHEPGSASG